MKLTTLTLTVLSLCTVNSTPDAAAADEYQNNERHRRGDQTRSSDSALHHNDRHHRTLKASKTNMGMMGSGGRNPQTPFIVYFRPPTMIPVVPITPAPVIPTAPNGPIPLLGRLVLPTIIPVVSTTPAPIVPPTPAPTIGSDPLSQSAALRDAVTIEGITPYMVALQTIAEESEGGHRASPSEGFQKSVDYAVSVLEGFDLLVQVQSFNLTDLFDTNGDSELSTSVPGSDAVTVFEYPFDFDVFRLSPDIEAIGLSEKADNLGCDESDFAAFTAGNIAIIERGVCPFSDKVANAAKAGAVGAIIYNDEAREIVINGALDIPSTIPVLATSFTLGPQLVGLNIRMFSNTFYRASVETFNVIAETKFGNPDQIIMMGAHLDTTRFAAGMNDNAAANGMLMEIAKQMSVLGVETANKVKFAFWGAEEVGLLGSQHYLTNLFFTEGPSALAKIKAYLNFDLIASLNGLSAIYPPMSGSESSLSKEVKIMAIFQEWFTDAGLPVFEIPAPLVDQLRTRSDHASFQSPLADIPSGGLISGSEQLKTAEMAAVFGGTIGAPLDPCYEGACDDLDNVNFFYLDTNAQASTHAVYTLAQIGNFTEYYGMEGGERRVRDLEEGGAAVEGFDIGKATENKDSRFFAGEKM